MSNEMLPDESFTSEEKITHVIPEKMNLQELAALTGYNRKTISEKLSLAKTPYSDGIRGSKIYRLKEALPVIYRSSSEVSDISKLDKEKLKLQTAKRKLAELELARRKLELVSIEEILQAVGEEYTIVKNILNQIPSALALKLSVENDPSVISNLINEEIQSALSNLKLNSEEAIKNSIELEEIIESHEENPED